LMSSNETLEKWGLHCVVWTFWTSSPVGAGCRLLWRGRTVAVKVNPSGAGGSEQVQNVQKGGSTPVFSSVSLQDPCPAEVQTNELEPEGWLPCLAGGRVRAGGRTASPAAFSLACHASSGFDGGGTPSWVGSAGARALNRERRGWNDFAV